MQQLWSECVNNRPRGPRSSCMSPGGGRCGYTPPCSWAPPDTTGTQHWGTASAPSVPGQRGRVPAADTQTHLSWNVCCCVNALYQVKREGRQLQTHTCMCLGMCVVVSLDTRSKGKDTNCTHTHALVSEGMSLCHWVPGQMGRASTVHRHRHTCLCTDLVSGQRGRAPNAHRYRRRDSETDTDTHAQTHISMCMYKHRQMQCAR